MTESTECYLRNRLNSINLKTDSKCKIDNRGFCKFHETFTCARDKGLIK